MTQAEIEKKFLKLRDNTRKAYKEFSEFRESVKDTCTHSIKVETARDRDNGYGRWWVEKYKYCDICGKENV